MATTTERMLINATQTEEVRVALMKDNKLYHLDIECPDEVKKKGNIYKATITRREPSLDAVFVEYGAKRQGFLPLKEISPEYFTKIPEQDEKLPVTALLKEGQELLVQVEKEERGTKGAALTTYITLAGCYLVLMPNSPQSGGISRRIEGDERDELKETLNALTLEESMGVIIRTAGVGKSVEELQDDLNMLINQWHAIKQAYQHQLSPCLIHQEGDVIIRSIRDNLRKTISEVIIDDHLSYIKVKQYIELVKPEFLPYVKRYNSNIPLFNYYQIESQIESAYQREVPLPSGGALVIDRTEALVSIDINSAKSTSGADIETTAFNTNLEAAEEIARQLRLRDLGGLIVIDFIDMSSTKHQRDVEHQLKEALKADRARIQVGRISRFGLLEMSRQRLRLSLGENAQELCPRCGGRGTVRSTPSSGLAIIRLIEEEALKDKVSELQVQLPVEMATFLMNEKRHFILDIEKRHQVRVVIIANAYMQSPHYLITKIKEDSSKKNPRPSYLIATPPEMPPPQNSHATITDEPIVKTYDHQKTKKINHKGSILSKIWSLICQKQNDNKEEILTVEKTEPLSKDIPSKHQSSSSGAEKKSHPHAGHGKKQRHPHHRSQHSSQGSTTQQKKKQKTMPPHQP